MEFTEEVLILKTGRFREADLWVRFATPTRGVLTAFAFGGSRSKRRFSGCLDALNLVRFRVRRSPKSEYLSLEEGELMGSFPRLRTAYDRLGPAVNCLKFLEAAQFGPEGARPAFDLALETLRVYETADEVSPVFPMLFRARLAFDQGYAPDLGACSHCGTHGDGMFAEGSPQFLVEQGKVVCACCLPGGTCGPPTALRFPVSPGAIRALEFVRTRPPADWLRLRLDAQVLRECSRTVDTFVQYHMGLAWERGFFRRV